MTLADIIGGTSVFVDANVFIYAFGPDPQFGPPCAQFFERVEHGELHGVTSSLILSDVAHRLMTLEACAVLGWPAAGVGRRLKRHPNEIAKLVRFRQAIESVLAMGIEVVPITAQHVVVATDVSQRHGLLTNDATIVAVMQEGGWNQLASNDADFDRARGIVRFSPV